MRVNLKAEATEYAENLLKYVKKAKEVKKISTNLANMLCLTLRSIYCDPVSVYNEAKSLNLPEELFCPIKYHLINLSNSVPF